MNENQRNGENGARSILVDLFFFLLYYCTTYNRLVLTIDEGSCYFLLVISISLISSCKTVGQERQVAAGDEDQMIEFGCFSIYTHNRCNDDNRDAQPMKLTSTMSNR